MTRTTVFHPESVKQHARALRREGKSIRAIARELDVPHSTVGDWLRGEGEVTYIQTCWCGERFIAHRAHAGSCSLGHSQKRSRVFGPTPGRKLPGKRAA